MPHRSHTLPCAELALLRSPTHDAALLPVINLLPTKPLHWRSLFPRACCADVNAPCSTSHDRRHPTLLGIRMRPVFPIYPLLGARQSPCPLGTATLVTKRAPNSWGCQLSTFLHHIHVHGSFSAEADVHRTLPPMSPSPPRSSHAVCVRNSYMSSELANDRRCSGPSAPTTEPRADTTVAWRTSLIDLSALPGF